MKFEDHFTFWVLVAVVKYSGVPWYVRNSGIPTEGRSTSMIDAKRFASRDEAIEWGNHLSFNVVVRRVSESRIYTLTEEQ